MCLALGLALLTGCGLYRTDRIPERPTDLRASDGTYASRVLLVWAEVQGAERYRVLRAPTDAGEYEPVGESARGLYQDDALSPTLTYWYRVRACGAGGCSEESEPASGYTISEGPDLPLPPTGLAATGGEHRKRITLSWEPAADAAEYVVHRAEQPEGPFTEIATTVGTAYEDEGVEENVVYWYRVESADEAGRKSMKSALARGWAL